MTILRPIPELESIILYAKRYYAKGWLPATAGNLSFKETDDRIWITCSGLDKGNLSIDDFLAFSLSENRALEPQINRKPSAETSIHRAVYLNHSSARTIFHVHNLSSMRIQLQLTKNNSLGQFPLPALELIKAFGIWEENPQVSVPVFYNHADVPLIAEEIDKYFQAKAKSQDDSNNSLTKSHDIPILMVENHGPTFWGKDANDVNRTIEAFDYILSAMDFMK